MSAVRRRSALFLVLGLLMGLVQLGPAQAESTANLEVVGSSDLGGRGLNGDVAVVGDTAVVASGTIASVAVASDGIRNPARCAGTPDPALAGSPMGTVPATVKVVDLSDPGNPTVASEIPIEPGEAALSVDAMHVETPDFTGDLVAVGVVVCHLAASPIPRGVEYYDVTNPSVPVFLGRYLADFGDTGNFPPAVGISSQYGVSLHQQGDQVLSLSAEPFATAAGFASGDLRIVDVTNPRMPTQVGSLHPSFAQNEDILANFFSSNGCRPFHAGVQAAAHGEQAYLSGYDGGLLSVGLSDFSAPTEDGAFSYPDDPAVEGNANHVAVGEVDGDVVGVLAEDDFVAPKSEVIVDDGTTQTSFRACEAVFTLFDPEGEAPVYAHPGGEISGEAVDVGSACPAGRRPLFAGAVGPAEPLLADPDGKIAITVRGTCGFADKVQRLEEAGAIAVIMRNGTFENEEGEVEDLPIFSGDGPPEAADIPMYMVAGSDGDTIRFAAQDGATITLRDTADAWGGLRILDLSDPTSPSMLSSFHTETATQLPPDGGVYAASKSALEGDRAWVAWNSDGVRVLDLSDPSNPAEVGSFVPDDTPDPTGNFPAKALVRGVALLDTGSETLAVATDVNSGLYVLRHTS